MPTSASFSLFFYHVSSFLLGYIRYTEQRKRFSLQIKKNLFGHHVIVLTLIVCLH